MRHIAIIIGATILGAAPARAQAPVAEARLSQATDRMFADPRAALEAARAAEAAAVAAYGSAPNLLATKARWLEGEALSRLDRDIEAEPLVSATLRQVRTHWPRTRLQADLLMTWGGIQQNRNHAAVALDAFQQAHNLFRDLREPRKQAIALVMIASLYNRARDNAAALRYFRAALDAYAGDPNLRMSIFNNRGNALLDLDRPVDAAREYQQALALAKASGKPALMVPILNNLARTSLALGNIDAASRFSEAGFVAGGGRASAGNFSAIAAEIALRRGGLAAAVTAIDRAFAQADDTSSPVWRDAHEAAVTVYTRGGRPADALAHLKMLKRIDDEVIKVAADTNTALLAARFDAANQQLRIEKLRTNEANQRTRFARDRALFQLLLVGGLLFVAVGGAALLGFALFHIHRSRREVRAANLDLADTNRQLGKALSAKREFLATTSHEFRTPLNGILGMSQVLLADDTLGAEARTRVALLQDAGRAMQALVEDVLDMASLDSGTIALAEAPFDLRTLLEAAAGPWKAEAAGRLHFTLDLADCPRAMIGDARRLRQIVQHLLSNAFKFTAEGSVILRARAAPGTVEIVVSDTGIGIGADQHERIFHKFYQVDGGTTRAYGGIGVGLALARTFAVAMGGTLTVESAPDEGATFRLRLPHVVPAAEPAADAPRTLLLVEANPLARGVTTHGLALAGFAVRAFATLEDAARHLPGAELLLVSAEAAPTPAALAALLGAARAAGSATILLSEPDGTHDRAMLDALAPALVLAKPIPVADLAAALLDIAPARPSLAA